MVSVYQDYGLPSQDIEIKVYKLGKTPEQVLLFTSHQK